MQAGFRFRALAALLAMSLAPLTAHHSIAAEFDASKAVILRGKVTKIAWTNPHVFFWIDVTNADGSTTNWTLESVAPNYMQGLGWTKQSLKAGDSVTVRAFLAKDSPNTAKTDFVELPDGRRMTTGRADDRATHSPAPFKNAPSKNAKGEELALPAP